MSVAGVPELGRLRRSKGSDHPVIEFRSAWGLGTVPALVVEGSDTRGNDVTWAVFVSDGQWLAEVINLTDDQPGYESLFLCVVVQAVDAESDPVDLLLSSRELPDFPSGGGVLRTLRRPDWVMRFETDEPG